MIKKIFWIIFIGYVSAFGQNIFEPVQPSGLPYLIVVDTITSNMDLPPNSEIGVFDDTLCVGAKILESDFPFSVIAWEGAEQYGLKGFSVGSPIIIKMFLPFEGDTLLKVIEPEFIKGDGTFGYGIYSEIKINLDLSKVENNDRLIRNYDFILYPNPSNSGVNILIPKHFSAKYIGIYNLLGKLIYKHELKRTDRTFYWACYSNENVPASSGTYFISISNGRKRIVKKFSLMK